MMARSPRACATASTRRRWASAARANDGALRGAEPCSIGGPAGPLEAVVEDPAPGTPPPAFIVVCHPHPLHGGTMTQQGGHDAGALRATSWACPACASTIAASAPAKAASMRGAAKRTDALAAVAVGRQRWPRCRAVAGGILLRRRRRAACEHRARRGHRRQSWSPSRRRWARNFGSVREVRVPTCPWLVVQGDADEVIDARDGDRLGAAAAAAATAACSAARRRAFLPWPAERAAAMPSRAFLRDGLKCKKPGKHWVFRAFEIA